MTSMDLSLARYFCHRCERETVLNEQSPTCSRCNDGFIEELPLNSNDSNFANSDMDISSSDSSLMENSSRTDLPVITLPNLNPFNLDLVVHQLLEAMMGPDRIMMGMMSDISDYGQIDFDNIVSQMLNRLENNGPPPANDEDISSIPDVAIEQSDVDQQLACSVCFDEFNLDELAAKLFCSHTFHRKCIIEWLKRHGTCPICRKNLSGGDATDSNSYPSLSDAASTSNTNEIIVAIAENFDMDLMNDTQNSSSTAGRETNSTENS